MHHESPDTEVLTTAAVAGDRKAFSALVERHFGRLYSFARSLLGDEQDAEDAVQDSFVRAFQSIVRFDGSKASFSTWMFTIVRNRCFTLLRARSSAPASTETTDSTAAHSKNEGPVETAIQREQFQLLDRVLAQLPAEQRVAFVLCEIQGMTLDEAAAIEEVPIGTIKSRRSRAAGKLRAALQSTSDMSAAENSK